MGNKQVIDMHVHFGAPADEESGCYWSEAYTQAPAYHALLLGASVHPYREDWQEELDFCLKKRAVLCKWIPWILGMMCFSMRLAFSARLNTRSIQTSNAD